MKKRYPVEMTADVHVHIPGGPLQIISLGDMAQGKSQGEATSEGPVVPAIDINYLVGEILAFHTKADMKRFLKAHPGKCREVTP